MLTRPPASAAPQRRAVWQALGALGFLTVLPLPRRSHGLPTGITLACFGIAGLLLGGVLAGLDVALAPVLPVAARSAVLLGALAALCGALHLDGLMDSADGLFVSGDRNRRLEVMRDSRVGGYGVAAALLVVLVQYSALAGITGGGRWLVLIAVVGLSRAASAFALGVARPARSEGLGSVFTVHGRLTAGLLGFAATAAVAIVAAGWRGVAAVLVALAAAMTVIAVFRRRAGGMTGDGFGAVVELALAGALLCFAARP